MTAIVRDSDAFSRTQAALSWCLRSAFDEMRASLTELTPAQHTELAMRLHILHDANEEIADGKERAVRQFAAAVLTPDCPSLPADTTGAKP